MQIAPLLNNSPTWQDAAPDAHGDTVILSDCNLGRNLADFPFPGHCHEDERVAIEGRIVDVLDQLNLLSSGHYFRLCEVSPSETQLLAERQLISPALTNPQPGQGVYVSQDQSLSIIVNDEDHCCIRVLSSGLQLNEAWSRASLMDDTLGGVFDFSYSSQLGYLTQNLAHLGTGLRCTVLLHLPGCAQKNELPELRALAEQHDIEFSGVGIGSPGPLGSPSPAGEGLLSPGQSLFSNMDGFASRPPHESEGDLFQLRNQSTLGKTEEEIVFQLKQCAGEMIAREKAVRIRMRDEETDVIFDRVERARAVARRARLVPFDESMALLSSLRLGVSLGLISDISLDALNVSLIQCQDAHVAIGQVPDDSPVVAQDLERFRAALLKTKFNTTDN
jgi:protein arginine kinase